MANYEHYKKEIASFLSDNKRMPSYREIMSLAGFKSTNAAARLVKKLVDDGLVNKDDTGRLAPQGVWGGIRLLGLVEAGFPSPAEEDQLDTITIDDYLIGNKEASYLLQVKGDSMIDAGIQEGDLVVVERGENPRDGDIVIAELDGGWTMKYLRRKAGRTYLEAANSKYPLMFPTEELKIAAIVKGVVRKY